MIMVSSVGWRRARYGSAGVAKPARITQNSANLPPGYQDIPVVEIRP